MPPMTTSFSPSCLNTESCPGAEPSGHCRRQFLRGLVVPVKKTEQAGIRPRLERHFRLG